MSSRKRQKPNPKEETAPKSGLESPQTPEKGEENLGAPDPATAGEEVTDPDAGESARNADTVGAQSRSTEDGQMLIRPSLGRKGLGMVGLGPVSPKLCLSLKLQERASLLRPVLLLIL